MKVVAFGAATTLYVPSNGVPRPATTIEFPAVKPCAVEVVRVTTFVVNAAFVIEIPRRMSVAPPPPRPGLLPFPPPFQPPVDAEFPPPTNTNKTSPGVTGITASTRPPKPAANVVAPASAPIASTDKEVTPAGTMYDCTPPVKEYSELFENCVCAETTGENAPTQ